MRVAKQPSGRLVVALVLLGKVTAGLSGNER
jgi:hypothetical protein